MIVLKETSTIGDMVAEDFRSAEVFKKHGIDFCCGGGKTIEEVCLKKGIQTQTVLDELEQKTSGTPDRSRNFKEWKPSFLASYIEQQHHTYVRESIPFLMELSNKVARVHGERHPELVEINQLVHEVCEELTLHLMKEEKILFPYILELENNQMEQVALMSAPFGSVGNPINMMEQEHEHAGDALKRVSALSNQFTPPEDACNSYKVLYAKLEEFENDLHQHVHLENNILFKKALQLENELTKS